MMIRMLMVITLMAKMMLKMIVISKIHPGTNCPILQGGQLDPRAQLL